MCLLFSSLLKTPLCSDLIWAELAEVGPAQHWQATRLWFGPWATLWFVLGCESAAGRSLEAEGLLGDFPTLS